MGVDGSKVKARYVLGRRCRRTRNNATLFNEAVISTLYCYVVPFLF
jgi:hypothetical protein